MSLFQKSVLLSHKHDEALIAARWAAFQHFKSKISEMEKEIDAMVYALCGSSEDEIAIVEERRKQ